MLPQQEENKVEPIEPIAINPVILEPNQNLSLNQPQPKKSKKELILLIGLIIFFIAGASSFVLINKSDKNIPGAVKNSHPVEPKVIIADNVAEAQSQFGINLLNQLNIDKAKNVFISPSSISVAMSMAYNGADGITKDEMKKSLGYQKISDEDLNNQNKNFIEFMNNDNKQVELSIANSVWADQPDAKNEYFTLKSNYIQTIDKYYGAKPIVQDLSSEQTKRDINKWVQDQTKGKINSILDEKLPEDYRYVLMNALYFKGNWKFQFDKSLTSDREFTSASGTKSKVSTMNQAGTFNYTEKENEYKAVQLPYGEDENFAMELILPDDMNAFGSSMKADKFKDITSELKKKKGEIFLPKFKIEYDIELNESLKSLGMESAFNESTANFKQLTEQTTVIDKVAHKTFLEVNEEGSEAAAVTFIGGGITTSVGEPEDTFVMDINKPFVVFIKDKTNNHPIFAGIINSL